MSHDSYFFIYDVLLLLFKVIDSKYTDINELLMSN